jgi:hypothetical protein
MADEVLGMRGGEPVGKNWAERFVARSDKLNIAFNRARNRHIMRQEDSERAGACST